MGEAMAEKKPPPGRVRRRMITELRYVDGPDTPVDPPKFNRLPAGAVPLVAYCHGISPKQTNRMPASLGSIDMADQMDKNTIR